MIILNSTGWTYVLMDVVLYYMCVCANTCICVCVCIYVCVYVCVFSRIWFYMLLINQYVLFTWCSVVFYHCARGLQVLLRTLKLYPLSPLHFHSLWLYHYPFEILRSPNLKKFIAPILRVTITIWSYLRIGSPWNWWWPMLFFHFSDISGRMIPNKSR